MAWVTLKAQAMAEPWDQCQGQAWDGNGHIREEKDQVTQKET